MTKDEKNRALAEWLGWKRTKTPTSFYWRTADDRPIGYDGSFDFFTSEEASALVLEAMPAPAITYASDSKQWGCTARECGSDGYGYLDFTWNCDRKTAIAEAALALIEQEKKNEKTTI